MTPRSGALGVCVVALLALAAVHGSGGGPPLYDGLCTPQHYLLLGADPGPAAASKTYSAVDLAQTQELATGEQTPQAQLIVASGSFTAPAGSTVTVTITPVKPPSIAPSGGAIDGNVYEFAARTQGGEALALSPGHPATVVLASTSSGGPQVILERFDSDHWTGLKTFQSGCGDTDEAASPSLGLFALVSQGSSSGPSSAVAASGPSTVIIVVVAVVVVLLLVIGATQLGRRRH